MKRCGRIRLLGLLAFLLLTGGAAKADPITFQVSSWSLDSNSFLFVDHLRFTGLDSSGQPISLDTLGSVFLVGPAGAEVPQRFLANGSFFSFTLGGTTYANDGSGSSPYFLRGSLSLTYTGSPTSGMLSVDGTLSLVALSASGQLLGTVYDIEVHLTGSAMIARVFSDSIIVKAGGTTGSGRLAPGLFAVPEPAAWLLVSAGLAMLKMRARQRRPGE